MKLDDRVVAFFKKHNLYDEEMFKYFSKNSLMVDYEYEEQRPYIGCYAIRKRGIITGIILNLPYVYDEITAMITVHELTHAICFYRNLNKKYNKDITIETLPMLYEKLYILENPSEKLIKYSEHLDQAIDKNYPEYAFALDMRSILLENYNDDITKMEKLTKKLARKHHKKYK